MRAIARVQYEARDHGIVGHTAERQPPPTARERDPRCFDVVSRFMDRGIGEEFSQARHLWIAQGRQIDRWTCAIEITVARAVTQWQIPGLPWRRCERNPCQAGLGTNGNETRATQLCEHGREFC